MSPPERKYQKLVIHSGIYLFIVENGYIYTQ